MRVKLYKCTICGQIVELVKQTGSSLVCCGQEMVPLIPGTVDAAVEKHVPVITMEGDKVIVTVGTKPHPMKKEHLIEWVLLETRCGNQFKKLRPDTEPIVCFRLCAGDKVKSAYAYCNLHGLWKV